MTAEGSTGAPLRQQIAEAIHNVGPCWRGADGTYICEVEDHEQAADAVVALLNLTEEHGVQIGTDPVWPDHGDMRGPNGEPINDYRMDFWTKRGAPIRRLRRERIDWTGPWLPSTPPDTSSSEPA